MIVSIRSLMRLLPRPLLQRALEWQWRGRIPAWAIRLAQRSFRDADQSIRHGAGRGLRFNPGRANVAYALGIIEPAVQECLARLLKPGDTFYDIGANVGLFSVIAARLVGASGRVHAFEPHPENARALRHNVALNGFTNVRIWEVAVADAAGEALLYEPGASTLATLRRPRGGGEAPTLRVPRVALDQLVEESEIDPPGLVKIDVEGAEADVLRGLARTITRYHPIIVCELHDTSREIGAALRGFGYQVTVLGLGVPVEEAPADAHVLALPA